LTLHAPALADHLIPIPAVRWILRTFLGWTAGFVLAIALIVCVDALGVPAMQFPLAVGMGLGVGVVQGRIVAPLLGGARAWSASTTVGLSLPFVLADLLRLLGGAVPYSLAGFVALGGVLAGALQWRLLRTLPVAGTTWWAVLTPIGWLLAGSTVWINELLPKTPGLIGAGRYIAVVLSGGVVLGVASAVAWRLMRTSDAAAT
jgi:hypothetical protein